MMITSYEKLLEELVEKRVEFALAGGLAVSLNGFVRTTDDVDILIDNSPENVKRLAGCLKNFGEGFGACLSPTDLSDEPGAVRISEAFDLDIFVQLNGRRLVDFSSFINHYALKSGVKIPYLRAEALIQTKLGSPREKDRADIGALTDIIRASKKSPGTDAIDLDGLQNPPE
jgi:hypothetical protein